jgi:LPXTG-site transpeptidase (sortase) family protein
MYPKGTIYKQGVSASHGEINLHASLPKKILYNLIRGVASGVIGFTIISLLFIYGPIVKEEVSYDLGFTKIPSIQNNEADLLKLAEAKRIEAVRSEAASYGLNSYFSIMIPKIGAKAQIIANVDAGNKSEYEEALKEGVAHAKGTFFPGLGKTIFLFAHSTNSPFNVSRYNAIFYLLDKESVGDKIIIYFADKRYVYEVTETKIVGPNDTSYLSFESDSETLILQTCYPPGTSWNRLLVFAKPATI